jgi:hypothetical protein
MKTRRFRLPLVALGITAAFEVIYEVADSLSQSALTRYLANDAPAVVQWLWGWSPFVLGVRLSHRLGYRFDHVTYSAPWQFDVIARTSAFLITAGAVWLVLWLSTYMRERSHRKREAT